MLSEVVITNRSHTKPFDVGITAASMSGTTSSVDVRIDYKIPDLSVNCGNPEGCKFTYIEEFKIDTGKLNDTYNSAATYAKKWAEGFSGKYYRDNNSPFSISYKEESYKDLMIVSTYTIIIEKSQPNQIVGEIIGGPENLIGKKLMLKKNDRDKIEVEIEKNKKFIITPKTN